MTQLPLFLAQIKLQDNSTHNINNLRGSCFLNMGISTTFHFLDVNQTQLKAKFYVHLHGQTKDLLCIEHLMVGTTFQSNYQFFMTKGEKYFELEFTKYTDILDLHKNGIQFFTFCQTWQDMIPSTLETMSIFAGGLGLSRYIPTMGDHITDYQRDMNIEYLEKQLGLKLEQRIIDTVEIDKSLIKSGDLFLVRRLDGVQPFTMVASGSLVGHAAMALWQDDVLWVVESQDALYFESGKKGIQKNKFEEWMQLAEYADYDVVWIKMKQTLRAKNFDLLKAWKFFDLHEGNPYGHRQQIFAIIDTLDQNYPLPIEKEGVGMLVKHISELYPEAFNSLFKPGMKRRLGLVGDEYQTFEEVFIRSIVEDNTTIPEILAQPEEDVWTYHDDNGLITKPQYSSSTFIVALYKAAGMFPNVKINAQEFTMRDVYQLDFFDKKKSQRPKQCQEADPHVEYCQLMGDFRIHLPGFSTIKPYDNMNEKCGSLAYFQQREEGC
ncbi:UNKNOWN [Stylonychia lemnae]|uniref:Uncharacterized protein n=1 Tax=Stylonychia lemnae TaxID=5949 RepID=A0A078AWV9_STYLE|nr:UNKNOWN [Stylonychia lemnae]|eukprot:CDW85293.1 UNKNOWN [Stylonychia lemnae]